MISLFKKHVHHRDYPFEFGYEHVNELIDEGDNYDHLLEECISTHPQEEEKFVVVIPKELKTPEARKVLETIPEGSVENRGDMTSEDLAKGDSAVLRMFAKRVVECEGNKGKSQPCELLALGFGKELAFITLPGEPFNGIAQGIRAASPYKRTIIATLAQGKSGYIPMPESFERGGYETTPSAGSPDVDTAPKLIAAALETLNK